MTLRCVWALGGKRWWEGQGTSNTQLWWVGSFMSTYLSENSGETQLFEYASGPTGRTALD